MALSKAAEKRRRRYLGASDVPAVLGVSPWKTASDVYYSKTAQFEGEDKVTPAIQAGNLLEPAVLDFAEHELGKIKRNQFRVHATVPWASATLDAICLDRQNEGVEAKTTGNADNWGDEGTDQIPIYYLAQVQWQMFVTGFQVVHVPVLMPDFTLRFKMYTVERDQELIESIVSQCSAFWANNVAKRVPPPETVPAPRTLQRMKRVPNKVVPLDDEHVKSMQESKTQLDYWKKRYQEDKLKVLEDLGDAEVGKYSGGVINYFKRERKPHTVKVKKTTYRSMEVREGDSDAV